MFSATHYAPRLIAISSLLTFFFLVSGSAFAAPSVQPRIIGGDQVRTAYPWMAALLYRNDADEQYAFQCGGTMVGHKWMLTAAHCVEHNYRDEPVNVNKFDVKVGAIDLLDDSVPRVDIKKIIIHPDYFKFGYPDLALVKLAERATELPISLASPESRAEWPSTLSNVIGWGVSEFPNGYTAERYLLQATVPVVEHEKCAAAYEGNEDIFESHMICAGVGGRDACSGDSGGPLFVTDPATGALTQTGIVAFGEGCALSDYPGVYTRVSTFKGWVLSTIGKIDAYAASVGAMEANFDSVCTQTTCTFDAQRSVEGNGPIVQWRWTFGDGAAEYGPKIEHTFEEPGTYRVVMTALDSTGKKQKMIKHISLYTDDGRAPKYEEVHKGQITTGQTIYEPGVQGFSASVSKIKGSLSSNARNLTLYLEQYDSSTQSWKAIDASVSAGSDEYIGYKPQTNGIYRWRIFAKRGQGTYRLETKHRQ